MEGVMMSPYERERQAKLAAQRAEEEARRQAEEKKRAEEEARAKAEKDARNEALRKQKNENLMAKAAQKAREAEEEADRLREQRLRQEKEAREARQRAIKEQQQRDAQERKRKEEARIAAEKAEQERQAELERQQQEKRQQMFDKKRQEEIEAETRFLLMQVKRGNVELIKRRGRGVEIHNPRSGFDASAYRNLSWLKIDDEIANLITYEDDIEKETKLKELERKRQILIAPSQRSEKKESSSSWVKEEPSKPKPQPVEVRIGEVRTEFDSGIVTRLSNAGSRYTALMDLWEHIQLYIANKGLDNLQKEIQNGELSRTYHECVGPVVRMLREAPGNIIAQLTLGTLAFCGNVAIQKKIFGFEIIPREIDVWLGTVIGSTLFFEFSSFKVRQAEQKGFEWRLLVERKTLDNKGVGAAKVKSTMKRSAEAQLAYLAQVLPERDVVEDDIDEAMSKFDVLYTSFNGMMAELKSTKAGFDRHRQAALSEMKIIREVEKAEFEVVAAQNALNEAKQLHANAKKELSEAGKKFDNIDNEVERQLKIVQELKDNVGATAKTRSQVEQQLG